MRFAKACCKSLSLMEIMAVLVNIENGTFCQELFISSYSAFQEDSPFIFTNKGAS